VQNLYNLGNRQSEAVLDYAEKNNIGFIPWFPLAAGELAKEGSVLSKIAKKLNATDGQVAIAWLLKRSPVMLPIPGTGSPDHLEENIRGASLELSQDDFEALEHAVK
jgi:aryl-alcohol dehydrogenase-like predicted oxidoreductase